jgi:putative methyltransferase (TIGR04325 family)
MLSRVETANSMPENAVDSDFNVWEGVYGSFAEAPAVGPGFDGPVWRDRSIAAARETFDRAQAGQSLDYSLRQRNAILPTLTAAILTGQSRVNILDFGGGAGTGYMLLAKVMPEAIDRVDYTVVEVESICKAGRKLFASGQGPTFHNQLPDAGHFDVVHAASAVQYIDEWRELIGGLSGYGARFLSLADIFIGGFATYVTLQNYYSSRIRHWLFNAGEFTGEVERHGYKLVSRSECDARILGRYGPLPMENFPAELRLDHCSNLLFCRADTLP